MVTVLILMTVSMRSVNNMINTTLPPFSVFEFNFSSVLVGTISAVIFGATLISTTFLNPYLKREERRTVFRVASISIPFLLALLYFSNAVFLWPLAVWSGIAFGIIVPNVITAASQGGDRITRERLLAIYSVSLSLSLVLGPSLQSYVLDVLSYRDIFLLFVPLGALSSVMSLLLPFPEFVKEQRGRSTLSNRGVVAAILSITTYNVPFSALTAFLAVYTETAYHVQKGSEFVPFIVFFSVSFLTRLLLAARPVRNIGPPLWISISITIVSLAMIPWAPNYTNFLLIMALLGVPHGTIFTFSSIMIARGTSLSERNAANSYFIAYGNALFVIVPVLFGLLSDYVGMGIAWSLLAIPSLMSGSLLFVKFRRDKLISA
ncbi:MFS transporter [Thermoplasmatales archaeon AK]|nr:MFS transporter [Thermoplasmatales archaeon AK]